jgi:hypothetical protein
MIDWYWEVWTTVMLWFGAVICAAFAVLHSTRAESRKMGLPTLFLTVAVLCLVALGVFPR